MSDLTRRAVLQGGCVAALALALAAAWELGRRLGGRRAALWAVVVTARAGQRPRTNLNGGISDHKPLVNS